jgi:hypothetical protein
MWSDNRSVILTKVSILLFAVGLLCVTVFAPWLVRWLIWTRMYLRGTEAYFLATIYAGCLAAAVLLISLFRLLQRISKEQVFVAENVEHLRHISWSCFLGAAISLVSSLYYFPWILVALSAAFMGLIVRVVKNVVARAVSLQDEVDYTV